MRLSTEQVRAAVMHPDQAVRSEAAHRAIGVRMPTLLMR